MPVRGERSDHRHLVAPALPLAQVLEQLRARPAQLFPQPVPLAGVDFPHRPALRPAARRRLALEVVVDQLDRPAHVLCVGSGREPVDVARRLLGAEAGEGFNGVCLPRQHGVSQCVFEYVYFSRPDSKVFGEMVDKVRRKIGKQLAHDAPVPLVPTHEKQPIVISVPDSSNTATLGYVSECQKLGYRCRYEIGLIRNHYVGRTFISPGQDTREIRVRSKFNTVEGVLKDRVVVMVDDSIVRGTTCQQIIQMARDAGAKKVFFASAAPAVKYPNVYGIDMPSASELIAHGRTVEQVADAIGADWLVYQDIEDLIAASAEGNSDIPRFDCAVFDGDYVTGDVDDEYLRKLEAARNDLAKSTGEDGMMPSGQNAMVGIHNS